MKHLLDYSKERTINDIQKFEGTIIFGAGTYLHDTVSALKKINIKIIAICDNDHLKHGHLVEERYYVQSTDILNKLPDNTCVIISAVSYEYEIAMMLFEKYGIDQNRIFSLFTELFEKYVYNTDKIKESEEVIMHAYSLLSDDESRSCYINYLNARISRNPFYLRPNVCLKQPYSYNAKSGIIIAPKKNSMIIDCGAYIGDTAELFLNRLGICKVMCIEPFPENYNELINWIESKGCRDKVNAYNCALSDEIGVQKISATASISVSASLSNKTKNNEYNVKVETLDNMFINEECIDFIKMDIEGYEVKALYGARNIIQKYKPQMAISAYHQIEHFWEIPEMIYNICSDAKIYLGHQMNAPLEHEYYVTF